MEDDQQFCLRWNNHQNTLISNFDKLLENGTLVDCTLAAEGQFLKAHKVVLSACSPYFANLLKEQYDKHPIFILKDVKYQELRAMMDYMYRGEVNISQDQLAALLKAAESLQIKGLSDRPQRSTDQHPNINVPGRMQHPHGGGYTLEQTKRPRLGPVIDTPDMREGSSSPTSRKRKKLRRRSIENVMDNHEHSNSSAHSTQPINTSTPSITSGTAAIVATSQQQQQQSQQSLQQSSVSQQQQQQGNIVGTKKTENVSNIKQTAGSSDDVLLAEQDNQMEQEKQIKKDQNKQQRKSGHDKDELLIEPKNEYEEVNEPIEDLTEDPEELMDEEDLDNQAGPSHHGGEGSSQGFPQWPADRSQDEFIMTAQDQGQQRDPQDLRTILYNLPTRTDLGLDYGGFSSSSIAAAMTGHSNNNHNNNNDTTNNARCGQTSPTSSIASLIYEPEITIRKLYKCCNNASNSCNLEQCHGCYAVSTQNLIMSSSVTSPISSSSQHQLQNNAKSNNNNDQINLSNSNNKKNNSNIASEATSATANQVSVAAVAAANSLQQLQNFLGVTNHAAAAAAAAAALIMMPQHNLNKNSNSANSSSSATPAAATAQHNQSSYTSQHTASGTSTELILKKCTALMPVSNIIKRKDSISLGSSLSTNAGSTTTSPQVTQNTIGGAVVAAAAAVAAASISGSTGTTTPKKNAIQFDCNFCSFSCTWKYDLKLHLRQKHGIHNKKI
ncbi:longitudinals lacking protein, isoforms N/O/W/X/Y isoform X6 [Condylostylus longicornis]|uniref:longitudinals lacking protein, isoforms N/O/W/X/Y isoform X6 n=1 Tax=Condylostylus longicornis TaxID=2530218 RepID=UPI00244DEEF1|nr:longitudinals lacking protein, isoforms N/O/W/X/Y isoform X6 [Condylostylus longicornis]